MENYIRGEWGVYLRPIYFAPSFREILINNFGEISSTEDKHSDGDSDLDVYVIRSSDEVVRVVINNALTYIQNLREVVLKAIPG